MSGTISSEKIIRIHKRIWKFCGLWQWEGEHICYKIYSFFIVTMLFVLFPITMIVQLFFTSDLFETMDILLFMPTALSGWKALSLVYNRKLVLESFDILQTLDKEISTDESRKVMISAINIIKVCMLVISFSYYLSTFSSYISVVLNEERVLVWIAWHPFDYKRNAFVYQIVIFFQFLSTFYVATMLVSMDNIGASFYCIVGAQLNLLGTRLSNLGVNSVERNSQRVENSMKSEQDNRMQSTKCEQDKYAKIYMMCIR